MKPSSRLAQVAIFLFLGCHLGEPAALGKITRTCNFTEIPPLSKSDVLHLSRSLGMPESLLDLGARSTDEQSRYWSLESITTDYGSLRYYLFAENRIYRKKVKGIYISTLFEVGYNSPWAAQSLPPQIKNDTSLNTVFNFNRRVLFSARAGHADIWQRWEKVYPENGTDTMWVVGKHYYFDPLTQFQGYLGSTSIYSKNVGGAGCDLANWGFEDR